MMSVLSFLFHHSDSVINVAGILGGVALWAYHTAKGDKTASFATTITGAIGSLLQEALDAWKPNGGTTLADGLAFVRDYAERQIWAVMQKRGVPRNSATEGLVHAAIESGTNELGALVGNKLAAVQLPAKMAALSDNINQIPLSFDKAEKDGLAAGRAIFNEVAERADAPQDVKP